MRIYEVVIYKSADDEEGEYREGGKGYKKVEKAEITKSYSQKGWK
jgi:hypothetical protein